MKCVCVFVRERGREGGGPVNWSPIKENKPRSSNMAKFLVEKKLSMAMNSK